MKSFKEYLIESKQTYDFKVKIAGDCPKDCAMLIKRGLSKFQVENCSSGKSTPIQETQVDFPTLKNVGVTIFDVSTNYPATSLEVAALVSEHVGVPIGSVKVRNEKELAEEELNHENDEISGEPILEKEYEKANNQDMVGDKHTMSLLKELGKNKKTLEQYTGVNEKILAKKQPSEKKQDKAKVATNNVSTLGTKKISKPDASTVRRK
jgi:hypothetical protein